MSKRTARQPKVTVSSGYETSLVRTGLAVLLVVAGIAWMAVYINLAKDAAVFVDFPGAKAPKDPIPWMSDLGRYNFLIGFLAIFLGLVVAAHPTTPLGRGRGVVIGMLGCFLIGLVFGTLGGGSERSAAPATTPTVTRYAGMIRPTRLT